MVGGPIANLQNVRYNGEQTNEHKIVTKFRLICFLFISFRLTFVSQTLKKDLPKHIWSWQGFINDTSKIVLSRQMWDKNSQTAEFDKRQMRLYRQADTSRALKFNYKIHKDILHLSRQVPDSSIDIYYKVSFNSNTQGYALRLLSTIKITTPTFDSSSHNFLLLRKRHRQKEIEEWDNIIIKIPTVTIKYPNGDSTFLTEKVKGQFLKEKHDTLYIDETHYEVGIISSGDTSKLLSRPIPLKNILSIYKTRENFNTITGLGIFLSSFSTLIVSPLVSIQKSGFNGSKYYKVAGTSLAGIVFFTTLRISFSHRKFRTWPTKRHWKFE